MSPTRAPPRSQIRVPTLTPRRPNPKPNTHPSTRDATHPLGPTRVRRVRHAQIGATPFHSLCLPPPEGGPRDLSFNPTSLFADGKFAGDLLNFGHVTISKDGVSMLPPFPTAQHHLSPPSNAVQRVLTAPRVRQALELHLRDVKGASIYKLELPKP